MTLEDFYFISQIVAALGIMASLIFVGMQSRQASKTSELASLRRCMSEIGSLAECQLLRPKQVKIC